MKTLIVALALAALSSVARAEPTNSVVPLDISSQTATSIVVDTDAGYKRLGIQNLNASQALYCGDSVSVSSIATNSAFGFVLPPATSTTAPTIPPVWVNIRAGQNYYCRTGSVVGTGRAVVIRER